MTLEELKIRQCIEGPYIPKTVEEYKDLHNWPIHLLYFVRCNIYNHSIDDMLWLYLQYWYDYIPEGTLVTNIHFQTAPFIKGVTSNDTRFNLLSFGFLQKR